MSDKILSRILPKIRSRPVIDVTNHSNIERYIASAAESIFKCALK